MLTAVPLIGAVRAVRLVVTHVGVLDAVAVVTSKLIAGTGVHRRNCHRNCHIGN
jgi:hypothetical protein